MLIELEQFEILLPLAAKWAEEQEVNILRNGIPLNETQIADAQKLEISKPERVRLLKVEQIPMPKESLLKAAAQQTQLLTPKTVGLTLRYGIFIRKDFWGDRRLIIHELVHTSQYEKLGGFLPFLREYLHQCITVGYPEASLEQEAIRMTEKIIN